MSAKNQRLSGRCCWACLFFLGDCVLPELIGRGWTLIIFAAIPFVAGLPFLGRAARVPKLRWGVLAAAAWYAILFRDVGGSPIRRSPPSSRSPPWAWRCGRRSASRPTPRGSARHVGSRRDAGVS